MNKQYRLIGAIILLISIAIMGQACGVTHEYYVSNGRWKPRSMNRIQVDQLHIGWYMLRAAKAGNMVVSFWFEADSKSLPIRDLTVDVRTPADSVFKPTQVSGVCREAGLSAPDTAHPLQYFHDLPAGLRKTTIDGHKVFYVFDFKAPAIDVPPVLSLHYRVDLGDKILDNTLLLKVQESYHLKIN